MVNRDKETVAVSATNRIQRCSSKSTERQRLQLHNRYALLTVDAQYHKTKPTTKPIQMVNRDKETVAVSATNRIQRCSSKSTERQRLQLHNRYALLTVDGS
ncbi:hypothetical protein IGI04_038000 [Brassica rapa subsp. trilocularis]|uniref:Uncharacterized protein n=1 Tax=Brassica rapa subsp. trilocularis TaxID=1813537 RepID=A0ABQ7LLN5_BRACM|nr:hypothetical protein IGI04_038000 [Brassica rapa subsp. trilocularis]